MGNRIIELLRKITTYVSFETRERSVTRIKLKATTCVFLPTGKYISTTFPGAPTIPLIFMDELIRQKRRFDTAPSKLTASFQRKSDKANTLRH